MSEDPIKDVFDSMAKHRIARDAQCRSQTASEQATRSTSSAKLSLYFWFDGVADAITVRHTKWTRVRNTAEIPTDVVSDQFDVTVNLRSDDKTGFRSGALSMRPVVRDRGRTFEEEVNPDRWDTCISGCIELTSSVDGRLESPASTIRVSVAVSADTADAFVDAMKEKFAALLKYLDTLTVFKKRKTADE